MHIPIFWIAVYKLMSPSSDTNITIFYRILVLAMSCLLDWWMYGSFTIVPLNFLRFNFFSSGGDYYGTHPWHWYFTQGFPSMLLTFLPYAVIGILKSKEWRISGLIAWVLGIYSVLGHKEFRYFYYSYNLLCMN